MGDAVDMNVEADLTAAQIRGHVHDPVVGRPRESVRGKVDHEQNKEQRARVHDLPTDAEQGDEEDNKHEPPCQRGRAEESKARKGEDPRQATEQVESVSVERSKLAEAPPDQLGRSEYAGGDRGEDDRQGHPGRWA